MFLSVLGSKKALGFSSRYINYALKVLFKSSSSKGSKALSELINGIKSSSPKLKSIKLTLLRVSNASNEKLSNIGFYGISVF